MLRSRWISATAHRVAIASALGLAMLVGTPSTAQAWFGWLDRFSGPGGYAGVLVDVRGFCFGDPSAVPQIRSRQATARELSVEVAELIGRGALIAEFRERFTVMLKAQRELLETVRAAEEGFRVTRPGLAEAVEASLGLLAAGLAGFSNDPGSIDRQTFVAAIQDIDSRSNALADQHVDGVAALAGTGVFISLCDASRVTRWAIDFDVAVWRTLRGSDEYAGGQHVWLTTVMPAFTWMPISNPEKNFVDIGIGAGRYFFASRGFDSFNGWVLNPRIEFHGPTAWYSRTGLRRGLAALTLRVGAIYLPEGIDAGALGPGTSRIRPEFVKSVALFFNARALRR